MVKRTTAINIRKAHRYLGIFLGIQFLMWTLSGMYFSWTDIDEIHGDHYRQLPVQKSSFTDLLGTAQLKGVGNVESLQLLEIAGRPYYWVNDTSLYDARTGEPKSHVSEDEALQVAAQHMRPDLKVSSILRIDEVGAHSEYRGKPLPAYEISYETKENLKAYVALDNGAFQTVRHRDWRWFDFLWMTHTMDYQGRDDFNTIVLRGFSLLGLITVLSGFLLWFISSPTVRKMIKRKK
ncbi:PepSY-associated TM region [Flagellimonas taeanensis]|uniref:PepSY-associated TM region n=1 Tax=Flagellimonas taeanensis TaxID=1005926 RepID=A0A1M6P828_9FLAO|nr:PepSY domain-containing protein [Allomuricauda taeanensis]MEE1961144.1 PepSY domain-containing protein [Allomuricauda taeanensis]SFB66415.1 PepSY-associated TM region [Allomuricauda taeanensis]SHK04137.1 PepSY-associated TM region [Allomuricauda taeanensis]